MRPSIRERKPRGSKMAKGRHGDRGRRLWFKYGEK